jgi:hypothetical protein
MTRPNTTHAAELESFYLAINRDPNNAVRMALQLVLERLKSPDFEAVLSEARLRLETAASS